MKIKYHEGVYDIILEHPETVLHISARNINDAKEIFLNMMADAFDNTINEYLPEKTQSSDDVIIKLLKG